MPNPLKGRLSALLFLTVLVGGVWFGVLHLSKSRTQIGKLYEARIIDLRVEDLTLPRSHPISPPVMVGTSARIECDRITPPEAQGRTRFRFDIGGQGVEAEDCRLEHVFQGEPGTVVPIRIEYLLADADGAETVADEWSFTVTLVPHRTYVRLRSLEAADGSPLPSITVPQYVVPYVEAVLDLEGSPKDYVALFFLRRPERDELLLRVGVHRGDDRARLRAIQAPVQRHRRHGAELEGFVAWPEEPIAIGNAEDVREMFEVVTGIFRVADAERLVGMCCAAARPEEGVLVINALPSRDVAELAYDKRLSTPIRVVRAARGESSAAPLPMPDAPEAPGAAPDGAANSALAPGAPTPPAQGAPPSSATAPPSP